MDLVTQQKLERRERILDAARTLIAESGYSGITVRKLARRCRVSVPTLYNQFGGKDALLSAAVEAHFRSVLRAVADTPGTDGRRRVVTVVELCAEEMMRLADYHRALLRAFAEVPETRPLHESLAAELSGVLTQEVQALQAEGKLADWVRPEVLAVQLTSACISASVVWSLGAMGSDGLKSFMLHATSLLMLGVAQGDARTEFETIVRETQETLGAELIASLDDVATGGA